MLTLPSEYWIQNGVLLLKISNHQLGFFKCNKMLKTCSNEKDFTKLSVRFKTIHKTKKITSSFWNTTNLKMFDTFSFLVGLWFCPVNKTRTSCVGVPISPPEWREPVQHTLPALGFHFHSPLLRWNAMPLHSFQYFPPFPVSSEVYIQWAPVLQFYSFPDKNVPSLGIRSSPWWWTREQQPQAQTIPICLSFENTRMQLTKAATDPNLWLVTCNYRRWLSQLARQLLIPAQKT